MDGLHLAHWRMGNLRLSGDPLPAPEDVVAWLGAVQSQDYGPATWSIGQRASGVDAAAVDRAFADGTILRTHVLRPTWHFVPPADIRWMLELTGPRVHALNAYYYRQLGLDDTLLQRCRTLLVGALRGGNQLTRKELAAMLEGAGIATKGFRLAYIMMSAELDGVVCSGAPDGRQHTYALLEERAPRASHLSRDEALALLVTRYFTSHGPATAKDLRWWSSLTMAEVNRGIEMAAPGLDRAVVDGLTYWFARSAPPAKAPAPAVHLLQAYDEYLVGYSESKYLLDLSGTARSAPQDRQAANGVAILDSQVAGRWRRTLKKDSVAFEVALHAALDDPQARALRAAADRQAAFLGRTATVATTRL
jgi:Winged helix DNA-binding domain